MIPVKIEDYPISHAYFTNGNRGKRRRDRNNDKSFVSVVNDVSNVR